MTSTISSENRKSVFKQGKAVYLWSVKRNLNLFVAYIITLMLSLPVMQLVLCLVGRFDLMNAEMQLELFLVLYPSVFSGIAVIFSLVIGLVMFSYLHNKRASDLFGSLPISRSVQFFARLLAAFTLSWLPVIIVTLISIVLGFCLTPLGLMYVPAYFGWLTLAIAANLSIIAILAVCAGSVTDVIFSFLAISAAWPIIMAIVYFIPQLALPGYVGESWINAANLTALTPSVLSFVGCYYYMGNVAYNTDFQLDGECGFYILWWFIFIAACLTISYFLIKRRKSECAQTAPAFSAPQIGIRAVCNFICGIGLGMLFAAISDDMSNEIQFVWFIIGAALGSFVSHIILQLIYVHRFSGFARTLVYYAASFAAIVILSTVVCTGCFGFDYYIPNDNEISFVSIQLEGSFPGKYEQTHSISYGRTAVFDSPEDIKKVTALHSEVVENIKKYRHKPYSIVGTPAPYYEYMYDLDADSQYYFANASISYTLKNGKVVTRKYKYPELMNSADVMNACADILANTDYLQKSLHLYSDKQITKANIYTLQNVYYAPSDLYIEPYCMYNFTHKAILNELIQAYKKDYEAHKNFWEYTDAPYDSIDPYFEFEFKDNDSYYFDRMSFDRSFVNTLAVLKKFGVDIEDLFERKTVEMYSDDDRLYGDVEYGEATDVYDHTVPAYPDTEKPY